MLLSVVVPTYNEGNNVRIIADALRESLAGVSFEVIFVDDSSDSTPTVLAQMAVDREWVRYEHREHERGLGTAVVRGLQLARGQYVAVMDADMQHPPTLLRSMLDEMGKGADIVVPSRFVPGGDDGGLSFSRKVVSFVARWMARLALKRVRHVTDPTSGFFMIRRDRVEDAELKPIGWKILIEVLVRSSYGQVTEIPYGFQNRIAGKSNMSLKEQWNYTKHLARLIADSPEDRRLYLFILVGLSGVIINMAVYVGLVRLGVPILAASVSSACVALLSNFILNDRVTWRDVRTGVALSRFVKYLATSLVGIGVNVFVLDAVLKVLPSHYVFGNIVGIGVATAWNFLINNIWTWRTARMLGGEATQKSQV